MNSFIAFTQICNLPTLIQYLFKLHTPPAIKTYMYICRNSLLLPYLTQFEDIDCDSIITRSSGSTGKNLRYNRPRYIHATIVQNL